MQCNNKPRWAAMCLVVGAAWCAGTAQAACNVQQMEIPVRMVDKRPIATLTLNGTEAPMLVDTGAYYSVLSTSTAVQLKLPLRHLPFGMTVLGYTGAIELKRTVVENVGLLKAKLTDQEFLVGGNELGAGIMGVLGRNFLALGDTEYDLAQGVIRLSFPKGDCDDTNFAHWAGEAPVVVVPMIRGERTDTSFRLNVGINGKTITALLDSGATGTVMSLRAARRAGIEAGDMTPAGRSRGAGEGQAQRWIAPVAMFELGGERIANSRLAVSDVDHAGHDMLLGMDYFLSHRIYVSRLQRKLYVTWNGSPIFAPAGAAPGTYDTQYAAKPQDVPLDDADALARRGAAALSAGDHARALDDLNRACALAPTVASHFHDRARLHLAMRQPRLAQADLDEALRLDPALHEARARRARLRVDLRDRAGAEADLSLLDGALPPSSHLRAGMGQLYNGIGQTDQALKQFNQWVDTHPEDVALASVLTSRCWLRTRLNIDVAQALKDCKRAVDLDGEEPTQHNNLGWTYLRLDDATNAKKSFDRAIAKRALPQAVYGRALALLRLQDTAAADTDLATARAARPQIDDEVRRLGFEPARGAERPKAAP